jgi:hypothetical protein
MLHWAAASDLKRSTAVREAVCINVQSKTSRVGNISQACWLIRIDLCGYKSILNLLTSVHNCSHDVFNFLKFGEYLMCLETIRQSANYPQQLRTVDMQCAFQISAELSTANTRWNSAIPALSAILCLALICSSHADGHLLR